MNKLPWYAAGVHQCICTHAREGAAANAQGVFPVSTNWTDNLSFVGREQIGVEYDQGVNILDHWVINLFLFSFQIFIFYIRLLDLITFGPFLTMDLF